MRSYTLLAKMYALGVLSSYSRPGSEMIIRIQNHCSVHLNIVPGSQRTAFIQYDDARAWVNRFVNWYNVEHKHSRIKYVTPNERHRGLDAKILAARKSVYRLAHQQHPE